jgi:hypothetical protein
MSSSIALSAATLFFSLDGVSDITAHEQLSSELPVLLANVCTKLVSGYVSTCYSVCHRGEAV